MLYLQVVLKNASIHAPLDTYSLVIVSHFEIILFSWIFQLDLSAVIAYKLSTMRSS